MTAWDLVVASWIKDLVEVAVILGIGAVLILGLLIYAWWSGRHDR